MQRYDFFRYPPNNLGKIKHAAHRMAVYGVFSDDFDMHIIKLALGEITFDEDYLTVLLSLPTSYSAARNLPDTSFKRCILGAVSC